ncbi:hypothetical protein OAI84_00010 [bacterium]|nr:hypothetical protein [bacterium]
MYVNNRKTRKKRGRGANKKLLAKRRTRKKRIKARTCKCGQVWGKNWLQCSKCGREWRNKGAPIFVRKKIEAEKKKVYEKWRQKALKNPRRKSNRVEAPFSLFDSDSESANSTTNESEYYDPATAWNTNNNSWQSNDSVGDPFEKGSKSHLRRYVYGYRKRGGMNPKTKMTAPLQQKMVRGNSNNNMIVHNVPDKNSNNNMIVHNVPDKNPPQWKKIANFGSLVKHKTIEFITNYKRKTRKRRGGVLKRYDPQWSKPKVLRGKKKTKKPKKPHTAKKANRKPSSNTPINIEWHRKWGHIIRRNMRR